MKKTFRYVERYCGFRLNLGDCFVLYYQYPLGWNKCLTMQSLLIKEV